MIRAALRRLVGRPGQPVTTLFVHAPGAGRGAGEGLLRVLREVDRSRVRPLALLLADDGLGERLDELGVPYTVAGLRGRLSFARFPFAASRLARELRAEDVEVVHAEGTRSAMLGILLGRHLGVPVLWSRHARGRIAPRLLGSGCDRIACASSTAAAAFPRGLRSRVFVVPAPASGKAMTPEYERLARPVELFDPLDEPLPAETEADEEAEGVAQYASSRRIARNTAARSVGEVIAKVASVGFYVVMARELGTNDFGSFIFALSLSSVVLIGAGFGLDQLLAREVSQDRDRLEELLGNVLALKSAMLFGLLGALVGVLALGPYESKVTIAATLIGFGVGIEMLTQTLHAVTQAYERMELGAVGLVFQRGVTAIVGIAVILAGGGLIAAAVVFAAGSLAGYVISDVAMRRAVKPGMKLDRGRWMPLIKAGAPIGAATLLFTLLLRLDASLISFMTGGDQEQVGFYGAAYRLIDATLFLGATFSAAMLPWLARQGRDSSPQLARGAALGLKVLTLVLLPIGLFYIAFAPELIDLLYGPAYHASIEPTRLLGAMTVLFGINWFASSLLIARDRPGVFVRAIAVTVVGNIALNAVLIPQHGASGAAFAALVTGVGLAAYSVHLVRDTLNGVSLPRAFAASTLGGLGFLAAAELLPLEGVPAIPSALAGFVAFAAIAIAVEKLFFADDYNLIRGAAAQATGRFRRRPPAPGVPQET